MKVEWISAPHDRPRCQATDAQGRRCREPVVWDDPTNRPVSTRCQAHGGLADAALVGRRSPDLKELSHRIGPTTGAVNIPATTVKKLGTISLGRGSGTLTALALAAASCLSMADPARADYDSAVTAYERGDYREAETEFETQAGAGDGRALRYLRMLREEREDEKEQDDSFMSFLANTVRSIFGGSDPPELEPDAASATGDYEWSASFGSPQGAWGQKPADRTPWMPSEQSTEEVPPAPSPPDSGVVAPQRDSFWSRLFHLPADATAIGLQYVARFLGAENFSKDLQSMSRHGDDIAFGILAGFWWLVIIRGVVGICMAISRFMRAATTVREPKHYG
jgi:hypothetical protein